MIELIQTLFQCVRRKLPVEYKFGYIQKLNQEELFLSLQLPEQRMYVLYLYGFLTATSVLYHDRTRSYSISISSTSIWPGETCEECMFGC